jgi:hypothetical protein
MQKKYKVPVILYESDEQVLPYIEVQKEDEMPRVLFLQEYKHTGETEPDSSGNEQPIVDISIHMYADMEFLSKKLTPSMYDEVRMAMGLEPLKKAREKGQKIIDNANENLVKKTESVMAEKEKAKEEIARRLNEKLTEKFFKPTN